MGEPLLSADELKKLRIDDISKLFISEKISKYFEARPGDDWESGNYDGVIKEANSFIVDGGARLKGPWFLVQYEDGDRESLHLDTVLPLLKNAPKLTAKLGKLIAKMPRLQEVNNQRAPKRPRTETNPARERASNDPENGERDTSRARPKPRAAHGIVHPSSNDDTENNRRNPRQRTQRRDDPMEIDISNNDDVPVFNSESTIPIPWRQDGTRTVGLPGHIKEIEVIDFMCHKHMEMKFAPHVTFISGQNGSGKSATLQALQCCLGVQARKTGRASSFKDFIRNGAHEAIVRVTIWNRPYAGRDAFRYELFGDTITVERRIGKTSSGWALKNSQGKKVTGRRDDLEAMLASLGINAANPVTVMTQDTARSFLNGTSNKADQEKYDLYMEATQLEAIAENLEIAKCQIVNMDANVQKLEEKVKGMEEAAKGLRGDVHRLQKASECENELDEISDMLSWALVEELEHVRDTLLKSRDEQPEEIATTEAAVAQLEKEVTTLREIKQKNEHLIDNFTANLAKANDEEKEAKERAKEARKYVNKLTKKVERLDQAIKDEQQKKESLEAAVQEATEGTNDEVRAVQEQYLHEVEEAKKQRQIADAKEETLKVKVREADDAIQVAESNLLNAQNEYNKRVERVKGLESELKVRQAADTNNNRYQAAYDFGQEPMVNLVKGIEGAVKRNRFTHPPIGPVGAYLELEDPRWAVAVESAIGPALSTFLVDNTKDMHTLRKLIMEAGFVRWQPSITIQRFNLPRHNIPFGRQPSRDISTILRVLRVNDPNCEAPIMNFLVDQQRIEGLALVEDYQGAKKVAHLHNVNAAFAADGGRRTVRGKTQMWQGNRSNWRPRLGAAKQSPMQYIQRIKEQIKQAKQSVVEALEECRQAETAVHTAKEAARVVRKEHSAACSKKFTAKSQVDILVTQVPPEVAAVQAAMEGDGEDGGIQNEIFTATQHVMDYEAQLDDAQAELADAKEQLAEAEERVQFAHDARVQLLEQNNQEWVDNFEEQSARLLQLEKQLVEKQKRLEELLQSVQQAEQNVVEKEEQLVAFVEAAEAVCPRAHAAVLKERRRQRLMKENNIDDPEEVARYFTAEILEKKHDRIKRKLDAAQREAGGSLDELEKLLAEKEAELAGEGARMKAAVDLHKMLRQAYKRRMNKLRELNSSVAQNVHMLFNRYMRRKGNLGRVKVDDHARKLTLSVNIGADKSAAGGGTVKDLKQLSGGERSYTTVAFALALGSQTSMPFRAMDEFDVFMDAISRRVAMENLLQFAKEQSELQFVFLTPLDMTAVEAAKEGCARVGCEIPGDFIRIVAMKPARDNNNTAVGDGRNNGQQ